MSLIERITAYRPERSDQDWLSSTPLQPYAAALTTAIRGMAETREYQDVFGGQKPVVALRTSDASTAPEPENQSRFQDVVRPQPVLTMTSGVEGRGGEPHRFCMTLCAIPNTSEVVGTFIAYQQGETELNFQRVHEANPAAVVDQFKQHLAAYIHPPEPDNTAELPLGNYGR